MAPRKKIREHDPKILRYPDSAMQDAIAAVRENRFKIREAARHFGVPHSTLINKLKCRVPEYRKMGRDTYFTTREENLLTKYIIATAKKGIPLKRQTLVDTCKKILDDDNRVTPFKNNCPGRKWVDLFLKRHPEITEKKAEGISTSRAFVTADDLKNWHSSLKEHLDRENALEILKDSTRIFNADESGFQTCPESGKVLGPVGMKNFYEIKSGKEKEQLTVMVAINAAGQIISPMIVYPLVRISREIATNVPEDWAIGKSPKGWMTGPLYYEYIANVFDPWLKANNVTKPVLLLIDGHRSHFTLQVSQYCQENQIIAYALFPNSTHISQPADVSVFKCLKSGWKNTVTEYKQSSGNRQITRSGFAPLLAKVFNDKLTPEIVANGFKRCGIYPFDVFAMDFTRCMDHESRKIAPVSAPAINTGVETLLLVESFMRRGRTEEFRQSGELWEGEESAKELFYVWKKFRQHCLSGSSESSSLERAETPPSKDMSQCATAPSPSIISNTPRAETPPTKDLSQCATAPSPSIISNTPRAETPPTKDLSQCATAPSPSIISNTPKAVTSPSKDLSQCASAPSPSNISNKPRAETSPSKNLSQCVTAPSPSITSNTPNFLTANASSPVPETVHHLSQNITQSPNIQTNKLLQIVELKTKEISPAFGDHIIWPSDSPIKKRKTERLPLASGSKLWQNYWSAKDKENEKKIENAENKKKIREEKKASKIHQKKKTMIIRSDTESEEERESQLEVIELDSEKENCQDIEMVDFNDKDFCNSDFVIFIYEEEHFVGEIVSVSEDGALIKSMKKSLKNWKWPEKEDLNLYRYSDIKEKVKKPQIVNKKRGIYHVPEYKKYLDFIC